MILNNLLRVHPAISLLGRTTTLVCDSGRLVTHAQVTTLPMFRSTPRKLQRIYVILKKIIDFHLIQSNQYLSEMLSKHWDHIKILPMITNMLMTNGSTPFDPKVNIYGNTHDTLTNGLSYECLEADQINLAGHSIFSEVCRRCSTISFDACSSGLCLPRGQYISWSKHFFAEACCNMTL